MPRFRSLRTGAIALLLAPLGCGKSGPRPTDADVAAYIAQSQPAYLRVGQVSTAFEHLDTLGTKALPPGSWRVNVHFVLHANEDLFAPTPQARARKADFDRVVAKVENYRVQRIAAVEQLARQAGLMPQGAAAPEPALAVGLVTRRNQDLDDHVTLLAQPDGKGWSFFQLDAQALGDDAIGAPMDEIRQTNPAATIVAAGSDDARNDAERARRFLEVLSKAQEQ